MCHFNHFREDAEKMAAQALVENRSQSRKILDSDQNENSGILSGHTTKVTSGR